METDERLNTVPPYDDTKILILGEGWIKGESHFMETDNEAVDGEFPEDEEDFEPDEDEYHGE